jgi:ribose transport system substrate-binding protein
MLSKKWIAVAAIGALMAAGHALAADKKTVAVSIPAADHGWTAGIVYHA